jgi:lipopolysaccharide export LptBFGC system permease protein LptF
MNKHLYKIGYMPKLLRSENNFNKATKVYKTQIKKEAYQPLSSLLNTLTNLCSSTSIQSSTQ